MRKKTQYIVVNEIYKTIYCGYPQKRAWKIITGSSAKSTGLKRSSAHSYLPYTKSIYNLKELSLYAERCRLYRARKKAVESLREPESDLSIEDRLWDVIRIFVGYRFTTAKNLVFRYTVSGNEIRVDRKKKSIARSSVNMALKKVMDVDGKIRGPEELGVYGASYLYSMFQRFGLI